jgi:hypothetical protein
MMKSFFYVLTQCKFKKYLEDSMALLFHRLVQMCQGKIFGGRKRLFNFLEKKY